MEKLKYIKPITWDEAFSLWSKEEAQLPRWIEHYKKRGFNSWEEWRENSVKDLDPKELSWVLFEVEDIKIISDFYAGPFRAWQKKYYGDKSIVTFKEIVQNREIQGDPNISELVQNFPKKSALIGLKKEGEIIIIEGLHRCCALALAEKRGVSVSAKLYIALADYPNELPILGQINSPT